ncbi:MAG: primosomal replication protein N [Burkholderiales bacterium]|nr:primosomal replication protein N [Burkholderiales bacterium]
MRNQVVASGRLIENQPLRYTPAGIAVIEFKLEHESTQSEAGSERKVQCEIACICLGKEAAKLAALKDGTGITVKGFLAARSQRWKHNLILHITDWKLAPDAETPVI